MPVAQSRQTLAGQTAIGTETTAALAFQEFFRGENFTPRGAGHVGDEAFNFTDPSLCYVIFEFLMAHDTLLIWSWKRA